MSTVQKFRPEIVLFNGLKSYINAVEQTSTAVDLPNVKQLNIVVVSEKNGTWILEAKVNDQWIPYYSGAYTALTPLVLNENENVPGTIRFKFTQTVAGKIFIVLRLNPSVVESYDNTSVGTLAWASPLNATSFQTLGPASSTVEVVQPTAASLKCEPTQTDPTKLEVTINQTTPAQAQVEPVQPTAAENKCEPVQLDPTQLQVEPVQPTAADNKCEPTQTDQTKLIITAYTLDRIAGQPVDLGAGTGGAGTIRVIPDSASIIDDLKKLNGNAIDLGAGTGGGGTQRVILDSSTTFPVTITHEFLSTEVRAALALTNGFVVSSEVDIEKYKDISIIQELVTGATGAVDTWLPEFMVEVSWETAGDHWAYINMEKAVAGLVTATRATYQPNGGVAYVAASTTYKDIVTAFENNPGWKRIRVSVRDSLVPTNAGVMAISISARN